MNRVNCEHLTKRLLTLGLAVLLMLGVMLATTAQASGSGQTVALSVRQVFDTEGATAPPSDTFSYVLTAMSAAYPMPAGSVGSSYTFALNGSVEQTISGITFGRAGIFRYTLTCVTEASEGFTIDRQTYTIHIYVTNYRGIVLAIFAENGEKAEQLLFRHRYVSEEATTVPPPTEEPTTAPPTGEPTTMPPTTPAPTTTSPFAPPLAPTSPADGKPGDPPKTGDNHNVFFWATLIAVSGMGLFITVFKKRKTRDETVTVDGPKVEE